jgi:poly [ADP-ribose] polymerase
MALIFNQQFFASTMMEMSYDANKLPLGKLSKRTLASGFQKLKDLAEVIATPLAPDRHGMTMHEAVAMLTDAYYTTIPLFWPQSPAYDQQRSYG